MQPSVILEYTKRLRSIAHLGLTYSNNEYDTERYEELKKISLEMMELLTGQPIETISVYFNDKKEYITPKVDVRAVIFNEQNQILLVREKADGKWSLPGGWADIGQSPKEVAVNEVLEETGFESVAIRLLALLDKRMHPHPPQPDYVYKLFILCKITGGEQTQVFDIMDIGFFAQNNVPELSLERVLPSQIDLMFEYLFDPKKETTLD
ncbi:NUDIX hydrolase N-terminal domain-containing protein [Dyadobacter frigoris]|uniref:NUDIX domain-containing protein n=1 Tax=Dyadobacter frigoris TaxID=2576211 RepID=A0A4U6D307_9BACT|nr:NUDIX hydrolase [Dyadobacter frigoris]TKT90481.1 NUDIX domain-containing protein [Dyadobacter frigoris]GLU51389.1 ADP-ribose pyrophosphatase [Dyadobacter frigoris]